MPQKKILLVEDELAIREMIKFAFYKSDFILLEAEDAETALVMIMREHPDLILLDWMLPGISGLELAHRLKKDDASNEIPIIMLTALDQDELKKKACALYSCDYFIKPIEMKTLISGIDKILATQRRL